MVRVKESRGASPIAREEISSRAVDKRAGGERDTHACLGVVLADEMFSRLPIIPASGQALLVTPLPPSPRAISKRQILWGLNGLLLYYFCSLLLGHGR